MADTKISDLVQVAAIDGTEEFAVNETGVSKKAAASQVLSYINSNISLGAALNVNSKEIVSTGATNIELHSDNDLDIQLGDALGVDDFNVRDSADAVVFTVTSDGHVTATSYGGITESNLVDKSAAETISGDWVFSGSTQFKGIIQNYTAGEAITAGNMVYFKSDSKVYKAQADGLAAEANVLGIAQSTVALDATVPVLLMGQDSNQAALTAGTVYYLSATAGTLTATPPSTAGHTIVKVGVATGTTSIQVAPQLIAVLA